MFQRFFTELRAARGPSTSLPICATLVALGLVTLDVADARRPPPPGYRSIESAVSESSGYWTWASDEQAAVNPDTGLRCPASVGAYRIEHLSNVFQRQFREASCIYANATGHTFSVYGYPVQTNPDEEICDGSLRYAEPISALAACIRRGDAFIGVVAGVSRPPTEAEREFIAGLIAATGNL